VVLEVAPSSPAADKRIEVGDVIAMANDEKITGPKDVQKQIDRVKAEGQKSILVVVNKAARRGDPHFLSLKVE
jgi:serine protease Do